MTGNPAAKPNEKRDPEPELSDKDLAEVTGGAESTGSPKGDPAISPSRAE
jgi:bacteriocin-like protein